MRKSIAAFVGMGLVALAAAAPAHAVTVETQISDRFQKKLSSTYGEREAEVLRDRVESQLVRTFERRGLDPARVVVTIEDAGPNRPTFQQLSDNIGLDPLRSFSVGGAKLTGVAYDASGNVIGKADYKWYETDITQSYGRPTWHDADVAFQRFAVKLAKSIA